MTCARCGLANPAAMRFCGGCGAALRPEAAPPAVAAPGEPAAQAGAHRRHMTVMFCDIVGSTPLVESRDPEDFRDILSSYQHACVRAIERFSGYTARYSGDGLVVYFGYPQAHEDSAQRAVHAALGILDELAALNGELRALYGVELQVRIGIHSGVVVVGEMGAGGTRDEHAIVGETPHIAARLESIAPRGAIVISDETRQLVEGWFKTRSLGAQALKGVSRPVEVHQVLGTTGAVNRLEVAAGRRLSPLVNRDAEMVRLLAAWQEVEAGRGATVHLRGEAGIGKSRVVHALAERLGERLGSRQLWQCSAHHRTTTLHPLISLMERSLGPDASPETQRSALADAARAAGLDPGEAVPLLTGLLAPATERRAKPGAPTAARHVRASTLQTLERLLVGNPGRHPLLLVVEDLHWADPTTVELLHRIVTRLREMPVLCVLTFRPGFEPPWLGAEPVVDLEVGPLSSEHVRALATWASPKALDPAVLEWVDSAADGVPLFVEETLKMLEQRSAFAPGAGLGAGVPSTLQGLLTERLDRLPELGDLIDIAAVLGREFDRGLLEAMWPGGRAALEPALVALADSDVLRPVEGASSRCEFTHALLQEAAYTRILRRQRQALHGRVADSLLASAGAVADREPEVVAHHWTCAAQPDKAAVYWRAAGMRALERAAFREASHHFRRGLEALDELTADPGDDPERIDLQTHLAASLQAAHGYAAAGVADAYARARRGSERRRDPEALVAVIRGEWMYHLLRADYATALALGDEMLARGHDQEDAGWLAEGHLYRGMVHMYLGEFDQARTHLLEAADRYHRPERPDLIYEAQGDTGVGASAYLAVVLWNQGLADESQRRSDLSLDLAERGGGPVARAQAWGMRSILHLTRGEPAALAEWLERTRAHSENLNIGYWLTVARLIAGWQRGRGGALSAGTAALQESLDAYVGSGSRLSLPHFYILLADLRLAAGERAAALSALALGEEHVAATGEGFSQSELARVKGRALMAGDAPDADAATAAYTAAVQAAREQDARLLELRAAMQLLIHQRRIGEEESVVERVSVLCEWFGAACALPDVVRARKLVAAETAAR